MSRGRTSRVPSGPSSHHRIDPFSGTSVVHSVTSCGRVALGTSNTPCLLLRLLWCPLTPAPCGRPMDDRGHRWPAWAGVVGRREFPSESATGQVCREAGGRVSVNVRVAYLDLQGGSMTGRSRHFNGAQLTVDATSCLRSEGMGVPVARVQTTTEQLCSKQARQEKETTCPELVRPRGGRARAKSGEDGLVRLEISWSPGENEAGNPRNCESQ